MIPICPSRCSNRVLMYACFGRIPRVGQGPLSYPIRLRGGDPRGPLNVDTACWSARDEHRLRADPCRFRSAAGGPLSRPLPPFQATPRSPSPMAIAKKAVRDLAPDSPAESMHHGPHHAGALLRRKDHHRADGQAGDDNYSHNDAPTDRRGRRERAIQQRNMFAAPSHAEAAARSLRRPR